MTSLLDFIFNFFSSDQFMPHGHCYLWKPEILWLHVGSDLGIALAYYAIPIMLLYFLKKRKEILYNHIFVLFGLFIFFCGTTHFLNVLTIWNPQYRLEGVLKLITAVISIITAIALYKIIPKAISLPSLQIYMKKIAEQNEELEKRNKELMRFHKATLGREERVIELKKEVNSLYKEMNKKPPYQLK